MRKGAWKEEKINGKQSYEMDMKRDTGWKEDKKEIT